MTFIQYLDSAAAKSLLWSTPYLGTEKIVGRGRRKSVTGWEVKIRPQRVGHFEEQGGGKEGELSKKKNARKQCFCAKKYNFFAAQLKNEHFLEYV